MTFWIYLGVCATLNLFGYGLMAYDKRQARRAGWRVPEKQLFLVAFLGGGIGAWLAMAQLRHKTKHWSFRLLMPMAGLVTLALYVYAAKWLFVE